VLPALLLTPPLKSMGVRGMGEVKHDQERVERPSLAFSRPILSKERRVHSAKISLFHRLQCSFVGDLTRAYPRFY
jgi:hypothetical protein